MKSNIEILEDWLKEIKPSLDFQPENTISEIMFQSGQKDIINKILTFINDDIRKQT